MVWPTRSIQRRHENGPFHELEEFEDASFAFFSFCLDGIKFENDFPGRVFFKRKSKMAGDGGLPWCKNL